MKNEEKEICHPDSPLDGPSDGVLLKTDCIRTDFIEVENVKETIFNQRDKSECTVTASMEIGTFSIRDRCSNVMLTISIMDAMEVLAAALNCKTKSTEDKSQS